MIVTVLGANGKTGRDRLRPGLRLASRLGMKMAIDDKTASEMLLENSDLDWTIAYVSTLTDRPGSGRVREVPPTEKLGMRHRISRADSATWMLKSVSRKAYYQAGIVLAQGLNPRRFPAAPNVAGFYGPPEAHTSFRRRLKPAGGFHELIEPAGVGERALGNDKRRPL